MLKRLELVGFKSFGKKTTLNFSKGITAIVGPNGSGKSNIVDAIRWLLGEREAKNIRGGKVEDLIFSGTDRKARVGMAQAAIYFDNSAGTFPSEFAEVAIARKLYRDGAADYLFNNSAVRLKDLVDFFAQAGLGTKGLSVISQGDGDQFVKTSPRERREMMEEILGLRQYQIKKHDAELKLSGTKANLEKTEAAINELLPRLRLLRRQAGKWEKRATFANELSLLENQYFSLKIGELKKSAQGIDLRLRELDSQLAEQKKELSELEAEVEKVDNQKPQPAASGNRRFEAQRTLGRLEAQLKYSSSAARQNLGKNKIKANAGELIALVEVIWNLVKQAMKLSDSKLIKQQLAEIDKKISRLFINSQGKSSGNDDESGIREEINRLEKELDKLEKDEKEKQAALENFNQSFRRAFSALSDKRQIVQKLANQKDQLLFEKDRWQYSWRDLEDKAKHAGRKISDFSDTSLDKIDFVLAEQRMIKLRNELAVIGEIDNELIKEAAETEERYKFLSSQFDDLRGATVDLGALIISLDQKIHKDFRRYLDLINQQLAVNFKLMFSGGKARLIADGDTIQINVSVPGKGIKDIEALSGGEKSLLAIAALFSLIAINPPPFIVLDEVDASLDETNSRRFADMLKKSSEKTQFIVVTHNRAVMESATALYGIAIDNNGVSKLLSLKLDN